MTAVEVFPRTQEQRMAALEYANRVRSDRAVLKRRVKAGELSVRQLLTDPPAEIATMKVIDLLVAVPKVGRVKAARKMNVVRIAQSKTVGGLSVRQRGELVRELGQ